MEQRQTENQGVSAKKPSWLFDLVLAPLMLSGLYAMGRYWSDPAVLAIALLVAAFWALGSLRSWRREHSHLGLKKALWLHVTLSGIVVCSAVGLYGSLLLVRDAFYWALDFPPSAKAAMVGAGGAALCKSPA